MPFSIENVIYIHEVKYFNDSFINISYSMTLISARKENERLLFNGRSLLWMFGKLVKKMLELIM